VTEEDISMTFAAFRKLDVNDEGVLNSRSIIAGMYKKRRSRHSSLRSRRRKGRSGESSRSTSPLLQPEDPLHHPVLVPPPPPPPLTTSQGTAGGSSLPYWAPFQSPSTNLETSPHLAGTPLELYNLNQWRAGHTGSDHSSVSTASSDAT